MSLLPPIVNRYSFFKLELSTKNTLQRSWERLEYIYLTMNHVCPVQPIVPCLYFHCWICMPWQTRTARPSGTTGRQRSSYASDSPDLQRIEGSRIRGLLRFRCTGSSTPVPLRICNESPRELRRVRHRKISSVWRLQLLHPRPNYEISLIFLEDGTVVGK